MNKVLIFLPSKSKDFYKCRSVFRKVLSVNFSVHNTVQCQSRYLPWSIQPKTSWTRKNFSTGIICQKNLTEKDYHIIADDTMDSLTEMFEDLPDHFQCDNDYDANYSSGVLTVKISDEFGTYVINKQPNNLQIWLSSPLSGPIRYDFENGVWIYKRTSVTMHELLTNEISKALNAEVDFRKCAYGSLDDKR